MRTEHRGEPGGRSWPPRRCPRTTVFPLRDSPQWFETVERRPAGEQIALVRRSEPGIRQRRPAVASPLPNGERLARGQRRWPAASWPRKRGYAFRIAAPQRPTASPMRGGAPHL